MDANLLLMVGNRVPDLGTFLDAVLSALKVLDLGLLSTPFREPQGIRAARGLGWLVLGTNGDCKERS